MSESCFYLHGRARDGMRDEPDEKGETSSIALTKRHGSHLAMDNPHPFWTSVVVFQTKHVLFAKCKQ